MSTEITQSQFYMWRTLFAVSHADDVVTDEELRYMSEIIEDIPFSEEQKKILNDDIKEKQDAFEMFEKIERPEDQAEFFTFASEMVWIDGDYGSDEQELILKLKRAHIRRTNVDDLVGKIDLRFEDDPRPDPSRPGTKKDIKKIMHSFRDRFLSQVFGE